MVNVYVNIDGLMIPLGEADLDAVIEVIRKLTPIAKRLQLSSSNALEVVRTAKEKIHGTD